MPFKCPWPFLWILLLVADLLTEGRAQERDDFAIIRERLVIQQLQPGYGDAKTLLTSMASDGHWESINYADRSRTSWAPNRHLIHLGKMAAAYADPASRDHHSKGLLEGINKGLAFWFQKNPVSDNWWYNTIGLQMPLARILILTYEDLTPELRDKAIALLGDPKHADPRNVTGQNLVWYASEQLVRGVLTKSAEDLTTASQDLQNEIRITTKEGIQPDGSFHQHGPQLYSGGYGLGFLADTLDYAELLHGTRYAFPPENYSILADYLLQGSRFMVRGKLLDYSANGRGISRKNSGEGALTLQKAGERLERLMPDRAEEIAQLREHIAGTGLPASFLGNKHFWNSDFMTHQREGFYLSVKMVSKRTKGTETGNGENLKGYWLPFGLTWIVQQGDEYRDIFPVFDWGRLPGVTSPYIALPVNAKNPSTQPEAFVGGVSDATYGAAVMDLNLPSIQGHKAWFFFDQGMVCLGSDITSTQSEAVNTTLNQTLLNGPVLVDGRPVQEGELLLPPKTTSVVHGGIGYLPLTTATLKIKTGPQTGNWKSINNQYSADSVTAPVFTLWWEHGVQPKAAEYAYAVIPGMDAARIAEAGVHLPFQVLANTDVLQAVKEEKSGVVEAVFHQASKLDLPQDRSIEVDHPCLLLVRPVQDQLSVAAANPTGEALQLRVKIRNAKTEQNLLFDLPDGPLGGSSKALQVPMTW